MKRSFEKDEFKQIAIDQPDGKSLFILINGQYGVMFYMRYKEDSGLSSRNNDFIEDETDVPFFLSNGQMDYYPQSWLIDINTINTAITYFEEYKELPMFITWHED